MWIVDLHILKARVQLRGNSRTCYSRRVHKDFDLHAVDIIEGFTQIP